VSLPYSVLKAGTVAGIDNRRKEDYLSDEEFQKVLGMSKDKFPTLPEWRRADLKKKAGLY
jgi:hypothetical protein